jgi:hypothetical protein
MDVSFQLLGNVWWLQRLFFRLFLKRKEMFLSISFWRFCSFYNETSSQCGILGKYTGECKITALTLPWCVSRVTRCIQLLSFPLAPRSHFHDYLHHLTPINLKTDISFYSQSWCKCNIFTLPSKFSPQGDMFTMRNCGNLKRTYAWKPVSSLSINSWCPCKLAL